MLSNEFKSHLRSKCASHYPLMDEKLTEIPVFGGDINQTYRLETQNHSFFLKVNNAKAHPGLFDAEFDGLQRLANNTSFKIPNPLFYGHFEEKTYLVMDWIGLKQSGYWTKFGKSLARMHQQTQEWFGLDRNNYIGSLTQINKKEVKWSEFIVLHRLQPLFKTAFDRGYFSKETLRRIDRLYHRLNNFYPDEAPALLHGDLWSGNRAFDKDGNPVIYDPAVYYGHREMDLAMMQLFGGFPKEAYDIYSIYYPLESGWQNRIAMGQLYPLLVHAILFGGSYAQQVVSIVKKFE